MNEEMMGICIRKKVFAFLITFIALVVLRYGSRKYIVDLDQQTIGLLFYVVAVSYIIPWRIACYIKFRKVWRGIVIMLNKNFSFEKFLFLHVSKIIC